MQKQIVTLTNSINMDISKLIKETGKQLCVGLDLQLKSENKLEKAFEIIDETNEFALAYKPNLQFWLGSSREEFIALNKRIHKFNCISILDNKLSDIGHSNRNAMEWIKSCNFDYLTVSPFPGNLEDLNNISKELQLGIISLVLMSNPEAKWMVTSKIYKEWTNLANQFADGVVIGTTNHVTNSILREISDILGIPFVLAPGIGKQGGQVKNLIDLFPNKVMFNVSRGISLSSDYYQAAQKFHEVIIKSKNTIN